MRLPIVKILLFISCFLFYTCTIPENYLNPPPGGYNGYNIVYTSNLDIYFCYIDGYNSFRPLGNNPLPTGQSLVNSVFNGLYFSSINVTQRNSPNTTDASRLDFINFPTVIQFFKKYKEANGISHINRENDKIHVLGVARDLSNFAFGFSFILEKYSFDTISGYVYGNPPFCIIQTGQIDSIYKTLSYSDINRKYLIARTTIHEIGHTRGLKDFDLAPPPSWDPHTYHCGPDSLKCPMWETVAVAPIISNIYPPSFCNYHRKVIQDSLYNKIINGIDLPRPPCY